MAPSIEAHHLTGDVHFKCNPKLYEYVVEYGDDEVAMKYLELVYVTMSLGGLLATDRKETAEQLQQAMQEYLTTPLQKLQDDAVSLLKRLPTDLEQAVSNASAPERTAMTHLQHTLQMTVADLNKQMSDVKADVKTATTALEDVPGNAAESMNLIFSKLDSEGQRVRLLVDKQQEKYVAMEKDIARAVQTMETVKKDAQETTINTKHLLEDVKGVTDAVGQLSISRAKAEASSAIKGKDSEEKMYDLLCSKLSSLEGYSVTNCRELPMSCDIAVMKPDHPTIRIENKAYAFQRTLPSSEVVKFERDLESTNDHGILCSHHGNISGRSNLQFRCMSTGKWAVYLAQLEYDVDVVVAVMHILYKLDQAAAAGSAPPVQALTIPRSVIKQIQDINKRNKSKLENLNKWMLDGQKQLKEFEFDDISRLLQDVLENTVMGAADNTSEAAPETAAAPAVTASSSAVTSSSSSAVTSSSTSAVTATVTATVTASSTSATASAAATARPTLTPAPTPTAPTPALAPTPAPTVPAPPRNQKEMWDILDQHRPPNISRESWHHTYECIRHLCAAAGYELASSESEWNIQSVHSLGDKKVRYRLLFAGSPVYGPVKIKSIYSRILKGRV